MFDTSAARRPWEGIGADFKPSISPEEVAKIAGIDWTLSKRPIFTTLTPPVKDAPASLKDAKMKIDGFYVLVRDDINHFLGPAGPDYIPTQPLQAIRFFKKFYESGFMSMETAGMFQGGKHVWALASINKSFLLPGEDEVKGYVLISSPNIWGKSLTIKFTRIRVICWNTYLMALSEEAPSFKMPHIQEFNASIEEEARTTLGLASEDLEKFEKVAKSLAKSKIDEKTKVRYIADIFQGDLMKEAFGKNYARLPRKEQARLIVDPKSPEIDASEFSRTAGDVLSAVNSQPGADLKSSQGTVWGSLNAMTYFIDHMSGRDRDNALYSAWFGPKSTIKNRALSRGIEIVEALR